MDPMNNYLEAFDRTMRHEGEYSDDRKDMGGETFRGISRIYWPGWSGWPIVDRYKKDLNLTGFKKSGIIDMVKSFYRINFWYRIQGDQLATISSEVAYEVFDTAVNLDVPDAVKFLQTALNMQRMATRSYPELMIDGKLGPRTITALKLYLDTQPGSPDNNEKILLACMNGEQYIHYKNNPQYPYFRGWFLRT